MRTLGMLGGMSYHSTILYYRIINAHVQRKLGSPCSASIILHSFNYSEINPLFTNQRWSDVTAKFTTAARHLKKSSAEALVIGCNIGHKVAEEVESAAGLPVLHIADAAARHLKRNGIETAGLLGTRPVMEQGFIQDRLREQGGLKSVTVPDRSNWDALNALVFGELAAGQVTSQTRTQMQSLVDDLQTRGAETVVLACTEFQFTVSPEELDIPVCDTLELHATYAADWAMGHI
jgi:aspartate racemase